MNNQDDAVKGLLVQLAQEGKISPEAAGLAGDTVMPTMQQEPEPTPLETMALPEVEITEPKDIKGLEDKPERPAEYDWPDFPSIYKKKEATQELFDSVQYVESKNEWDAVSKSNAVGLMQILPEYSLQPGHGAKNVFQVAEELGVDTTNIPRDIEGATKLLYMPEVNRKYGEGYLKAMINTFGDVATGLIAYNRGPTATRQWLAKGGNWSELDAEGRGYLDKIERTLNGEDVYAAKD